MKHRTVVLAACLVASLSAVFGLAEKGSTSARSSLHFLPAGNLQVGIPGELLAEPIAVQAAPGSAVQFYSPDLGILEESHGSVATVLADESGTASVHVRLGQNLGRYTVVASLAQADGPQLLYSFRAIEPQAMQVRRAKFTRAGVNEVGGAR